MSKNQEDMSLQELRMILQFYGQNYGRQIYPDDVYCDVCGHDFSSVRNLNRHLDTKKHDKEIQRLNLALDWAERSGRLGDFRATCKALNSLPSQASKEEFQTAFQKTWAVLKEIESYWKINHSAATTTKSAPPISL